MIVIMASILQEIFWGVFAVLFFIVSLIGLIVLIRWCKESIGNSRRRKQELKKIKSRTENVEDKDSEKQ